MVEIIVTFFKGTSKCGSFKVGAAFAPDDQSVIRLDGHADHVEALLLRVEQGEGHARERQQTQRPTRHTLDDLVDVERAGNRFHHFVQTRFLLGAAYRRHVQARVFDGGRRLMREDFKDFDGAAVWALAVEGTIQRHNAEDFTTRAEHRNQQHIAVAPIVSAARVHGSHAGESRGEDFQPFHVPLF